jgi:hypothetical protein
MVGIERSSSTASTSTTARNVYDHVLSRNREFSRLHLHLHRRRQRQKKVMMRVLLLPRVYHDSSSNNSNKSTDEYYDYRYEQRIDKEERLIKRIILSIMTSAFISTTQTETTTNSYARQQQQQQQQQQLERVEKFSELKRVDKIPSNIFEKKKVYKPLPLNLSANDDDIDDTVGIVDDDERYDTGVPSSPSASKSIRTTASVFKDGRTISAIFQWAFILYVFKLANDGRTKGIEISRKLGVQGKAQTELINTKWTVEMDFGRERGTWMPPSWANSGKRVILPIRIIFLENNEIKIDSVGAFCPIDITPGSWNLDGDTLRFSIVLGNRNSGEKLERGDLTFDAGEVIFCKTNAWGNKLGRRGNLLVRKTRFAIRKEWRSVGIFTASDEIEETLGTMRVRERFTN